MRLNQPQDRVPPLQAPILTNRRARDRRRWPLRLAHKQSSGSTEGVQEGADDVTALLVARLLYVPAIARVDLRCG